MEKDKKIKVKKSDKEFEEQLINTLVMCKSMKNRKSIDRTSIEFYFEILRKLLDDLGCVQGDRRLHFGANIKESEGNSIGLNFTIFDSYFFSIPSKNNYLYKFNLFIPIAEIVNKVTCKKHKSKNFWIITISDLETVEHYYIDVLKAAQGFLNRDLVKKKSSKIMSSKYRDLGFTNTAFERAIFDEQYRKEIFQKVFGSGGVEKISKS